MQIAPPKPLKVGNEYRDAIQARFGGNWSTPDLIAGQAHVNDVGWATVQTGGGTFFHKPLLNGECPWERTKAMYKAVDAPNSILVRGDTLVGYQTNPDDVIEGFIEAQARAGVDVFTIFDGLNDTRNQIGVIQAVNKMKPQIKADTGRDLKAEGVICVGDSPEYTMERYMQTARELHKAGADNFYIKDPCGVVHPDVVFELVSRLKEEFPAMDVTMHSHNCYGLAYAQYIAAIEAGADQVNALHPLLADSTAQPCVLSLIDMMKNHPNPEVRARVPDINVDALKADNEPVAERCLKYRDYEKPFDPARLAAMYGAKAPGGASSTLYGVVGKTLEQAGFKKEDWPQTERMIYEHEAKISPLLGNVLKVTPQAMTMTTVAAMSLANMPKDWDEEQNGPFVFLTPDLIKLISDNN